MIKTLVLFMLVGCAATSNKIKGPDGTDHFSISCDEFVRCYKKASELCGKYKIVNSSHNVNHEGGSHLLVKCEEK